MQTGGNQQNLRDDRMSGAHSFGSYCRRSSQPRKVSIGIMLESSPSRISAAPKEDEIPAVETEKVVFDNKITTGWNNNEKCTRKMDEESSPWIAPKFSRPRIPSTGTTSTLPGTSEGKHRLNGPKVSVHPLVAKTSALQSSDGNHKEFDAVTYQRKRGTTERVGEQEDPLVDKPVIQEETENNGTTNNLRRKLFEILGAVSSPKSQVANSQNQGANVNNLKAKPVDKEDDVFLKPRLSSDTIEADSESPQQSIRRPVTRSLIRKKASIEVKANKTKIDVPLSYQKKHQDNSDASFQEGRSGGIQNAVHSFSSMSMKKKSKQAKNMSKQLKEANSENAHPMKDHQAKRLSKTPTPSEKEPSKSYIGTIKKATHSTVTSLPADKTSSLGKDFIDIHARPLEDDSEDTELNSNKRKSNFRRCSPFENATPNISTFPSPRSEAHQMSKNIYSPEPQRKFTLGDTLSPMLSSPKPKYFRCDFGSKAHDEEEFNSSMKTAGTDMEEEDSEDNHSRSSEDQESRSSEEGSPVAETNSGDRKRAKFSERARNCEEGTLMFSCPLKRLRNLEGFHQNEFAESDWIEESPDEMQDTGLARAVALFSLALDKLRKKMASLTRKKCSDILVAVTEGVCLQLQNAESQIQADMGKLTSINKSKRKQLEIRFKEQQEQLKLITIKFQEEVRHHLQASKNIIEDMSAQQIELKETVEKQKLSHQKLFSEVEETVETELGDAQRRITAVQEVARERMFHLKQVIAECLKDGILS